MSPLAIGLVVFAVTTALLATGLPIAFGLGAVSLLFMIVFDGWNSVHFIPETVFAGLNDFTLVSLPMFIIMGAAVASSRAGSDLYEALSRWLHRVPGSLVISNIGACALFSALTGSSPATCAAIGKMGIPEMRRRGYDADLADTWGHALVGAVRAATDQWIRSGMHRPADDVAGDLAALVGPAFNLVTTINEEHR